MNRTVRLILLERDGAWTVLRSRSMILETIAPIPDDPIIGLAAMADRSAQPMPEIVLALAG